jgi:DNA-binding transcriptional MerR regulator
VDGSHTSPGGVGLTVGRAAELLGLAPSVLRYYDDIGLVPADKDAAGYRRYHERHLKAVALVRAAQDLGFSLDDVRELVQLDPAARDARRILAQRKIAEIDRTTTKLAAVRSFLEHAQSCTCHDPSQCQAS